MFIFLDDYRNPNDALIRYGMPDIPVEQWKVVRNIDQFKVIVRNYLPEIAHIAFDHDLADQHYGGDLSDGRTGYDCAKFLVEECMDRNLPLPSFSSHSMNPSGRENILSYLECYKKVSLGIQR